MFLCSLGRVIPTACSHCPIHCTMLNSEASSSAQKWQHSRAIGRRVSCESIGSAIRRNQFRVVGWQPTGQYFLRYGHSAECPLRAFVCEHAGRMPLTRIQSVVAWAHRPGSLLLVCHGIGMNPGSEGSPYNFVAPQSVARFHHWHTRNEAESELLLSAKQGIRSSVTELLGSAL